MRNPVWPSPCVTPAGTSNELDVQNEWEENTHTLQSILVVLNKCGDRPPPILCILYHTWQHVHYWHCAGGLSAGNAIGTQLRDLINPGLTRWRLTVYVDAVAESRRNPARRHQNYVRRFGQTGETESCCVHGFSLRVQFRFKLVL